MIALLRCGCIVMLVGCGRIDFAARNDASSGRCDIAAPFGEPTLVPGLSSSAADITLRLEADERNGVFWSLRTGDADIFAASRPDLASPFTATVLTAVNSVGAVDSDPTINGDGTFIVFGSGRAGGMGMFDLYEASGSFPSYSAPVPLVALNTAMNESQPNYSNAESALYFSSDRGGASRLYRAVRTGAATYDPPAEVTELSSGSNGEEYDPAPSADGLALYFRSSRPGGPGGTDAYVATRSALGEPFGAATLVNINSPAIDGPSFLSPDQCRLYFTSDRTGTPKLYVAAR